jgi:hypothetical protein
MSSCVICRCNLIDVYLSRNYWEIDCSGIGADAHHAAQICV